MPLALIAALAASLLTHVSAVLLPDVDWLPKHKDEARHDSLQATLSATPFALPSPAEKPRPKAPAKKPTPSIRTTETAPLSNTTDQPNVASEPLAESPNEREVAIANQPPDSTAQRPAVPPPGGSTEGELRFRIYRGSDHGFWIGRAIQQWRIQGESYVLSSTTETIGLAGLFYPLRLDLSSQGHFGPDGFVPVRLESRKQGQATDENVDFDWAAQRVRLTRDQRDRPLAAGSQDILSFVFQLAYQVQTLGEGQHDFPLSVASGKRYDPFDFTVLGSETVHTPAGEFRSLHLKAVAPNLGADTTEVWLATAHRHLPIKIRFTDKHGDSFEQVLESLPPERNPSTP